MKTANCDKLCDNIRRLDLRFVMRIAVMFDRVSQRVAAFCGDSGQFTDTNFPGFMMFSGSMDCFNCAISR